MDLLGLASTQALHALQIFKAKHVADGGGRRAGLEDFAVKVLEHEPTEALHAAAQRPLLVGLHLWQIPEELSSIILLIYSSRPEDVYRPILHIRT
eukprot:scaffold151899_cov20-Prasinocladus_malaysianus.AAC.1